MATTANMCKNQWSTTRKICNEIERDKYKSDHEKWGKNAKAYVGTSIVNVLNGTRPWET